MASVRERRVTVMNRKWNSTYLYPARGRRAWQPLDPGRQRARLQHRRHALCMRRLFQMAHIMARMQARS